MEVPYPEDEHLVNFQFCAIKMVQNTVMYTYILYTYMKIYL